jgi:hypothetical protein
MPTLTILPALSFLLVTPTLVILAFWTTALASTALLIRVAIVYVELGLALLRDFVRRRRGKAGDGVISEEYRRRSEARRSALVRTNRDGAMSTGTVGNRHGRIGSASAVELRDYESVGGWL